MFENIARKLAQPFVNALSASNFHPTVKEKAPEALVQQIKQYIEPPENRDGRGVKASVNQSVKKTVRQLVCATRHADYHSDPNIRSKAQKLIRSISSSTFKKTADCASKFRGLCNKVGRRRNERNLREERNRLTLEVNDKWSLVPVLSSDQLVSTGKELGNCVARKRGPGSGYHDALREGNSKFYRLEEEGTAAGLIQIDSDTNAVEEAQGRGREELELSRKNALAVLRELDATADDVDAFSRVGAFSVFLPEPQPLSNAFDHNEWNYKIGVCPGEKKIVVRRKRTTHPEEARAPMPTSELGRQLHRIRYSEDVSPWSLFAAEPMPGRYGRRRARRAEGRPAPTDWRAVCMHDGAMNIGEFLDLLMRRPAIAEWIHKALYAEE